jgi:hypothetical protein
MAAESPMVTERAVVPPAAFFTPAVLGRVAGGTLRHALQPGAAVRAVPALPAA